MNFGNKIRVAILKYNESNESVPGAALRETVSVLREHVRHYDADNGRTFYNFNGVDTGLSGVLADLFLKNVFELLSLSLASRAVVRWVALDLVDFCREHNVDLYDVLRSMTATKPDTVKGLTEALGKVKPTPHMIWKEEP